MKSENHLFASGMIGNLELPNRVLMAPMEKNFCRKDGSVTDRYIRYLVARARGGVALLRCEAAYVLPSGKGRMYQLGVHADHVLDGLTALADSVHSAGGRISAELCHSGRETNVRNTWRQPVAASPVRCRQTGGYLPRELTAQEIRDLVGKFGDAASRCMRAGFDAVEIHGASGYLLNSFLSPLTNQRHDEWGGSFANRARFPLAVVRDVRERIGDDMPLLYRLCADEFVSDGLHLEETIGFAQELELNSVDFIDVTGGIYESSLHMIPPMEAVPAEHLGSARRIREVLTIPVGTTGKLGTDLASADQVIRAGDIDFVSIGRALHADPDLVRKAVAGELGSIRPCTSCSECSHFLALDSPAYCAVNPATGRESLFGDIRRSRHQREVMVVGAGPAGLEAARTAALRGHKVVVYERDRGVGGQVRYAARAPGREAMMWPVRFLERELERLGVRVVCDLNVSASLVEDESPDVVILATGAMPATFELPLEPSAHVVSPLDVLAGEGARLGEDESNRNAKRGVVLGGNWMGCLAASYLADDGWNVHIVEVGESLAPDIGGRPGMFVRERLLGHPKVQISLSAMVASVTSDLVEIQTNEARSMRLKADLLVLSAGMEPASELADTLAGGTAEMDIYAIGDCVRPSNYHDAILDAVKTVRLL